MAPSNATSTVTAECEVMEEEEEVHPEQVGRRLEMLRQEALRGEEGRSAGRLRACDGCSRSENRNTKPLDASGENRT